MEESKKVCNCTHHKVVPVSIVLIGLSFLLMQWNILTAEATAMIWPVLLIVIGVVKYKGAGCSCC